MDVRGPDGQIVRFPDGTAPDTIHTAMASLYTQNAPGSDARPTSFLQGVEEGVGKVHDNAATFLRYGAGKLGLQKPIDALGTALGMPSLARAKQAYQDQKAAMPTRGSGLGRLVGNVAAAALVPGGPIAQGAASGGLLTDNQTPGGVAKDMLYGGVGGKIADKGLKLIGGTIAPPIEAGIRRLGLQNVPMTIGNVLQGAAKNAEDRLMSLPWVGDAIHALRDNSINQVNRVATNRAVAPLGQFTPGAGIVPEGIPTGHPMVKAAGDALSTGYQRVLARIKPVAADPTFNTRLFAIKARAGMPAAQNTQFDQIVSDDILAHFQNGPVDGKNLKRLDEKLKTYATGYMQNDDPHVRLLGQAVADARQQMMGMVRRQNPGLAKPLRALDEGWANLVRVETAAGKSVNDGIFQPGELRTAVRQTDQSTRKRAVSRGEALMQDLASDSSLLTSKTGNSGTADRMAQASLWKNALGATLAPLYRPGAQQFAQKLLLAPRPAAAHTVADTLKKLPPGAAGSALLKLLLSPGQ